MKINLKESLREIKCHVHFIVGQQDIQTSFDLSEEYFNIINTPSKEIYILPGVGHNVTDEAPNKVQNIMIDKINSQGIGFLIN